MSFVSTEHPIGSEFTIQIHESGIGNWKWSIPTIIKLPVKWCKIPVNSPKSVPLRLSRSHCAHISTIATVETRGIFSRSIRPFQYVRDYIIWPGPVPCACTPTQAHIHVQSIVDYTRVQADLFFYRICIYMENCNGSADRTTYSLRATTTIPWILCTSIVYTWVHF